MAYLTKEQLKKAVENARPLTVEEKKKAEELDKKMKSLSKEELKKLLEETNNDW